MPPPTVGATTAWTTQAIAYSTAPVYVWAPDPPGNLYAQVTFVSTAKISVPMAALPQALRSWPPTVTVTGEWTMADDGLWAADTPATGLSTGVGVKPPGSGGYLHTHTPVDKSLGDNDNAPAYPAPLYASIAEWPTAASTAP
jgi:hypothetical protein